MATFEQKFNAAIEDMARIAEALGFKDGDFIDPQTLIKKAQELRAEVDARRSADAMATRLNGQIR